MFSEYTFTEARANLTAVVDRALTSTPQIIKKRKQSERDIVLMDIETQKQLLTAFSLHPDEIIEDDGSVTLVLEPLTIYANGGTAEEAQRDLVEQLLVYTEEYLSNIQLYRNSPNRRAHFPYIVRIALCSDGQELERMFNA